MFGFLEKIKHKKQRNEIQPYFNYQFKIFQKICILYKKEKYQDVLIKQKIGCFPME